MGRSIKDEDRVIVTTHITSWAVAKCRSKIFDGFAVTSGGYSVS
jgi:hypothetical protein